MQSTRDCWYERAWVTDFLNRNAGTPLRRPFHDKRRYSFVSTAHVPRPSWQITLKDRFQSAVRTELTRVLYAVYAKIVFRCVRRVFHGLFYRFANITGNVLFSFTGGSSSCPPSDETNRTSVVS